MVTETYTDSTLTLYHSLKSGNKWEKLRFHSRMLKKTDSIFYVFKGKQMNADYTIREVIEKLNYGFKIRETSANGKLLFEAEVLHIFPVVFHGKYVEFDLDGMPMNETGFANGSRMGQKFLVNPVNKSHKITNLPEFPGGQPAFNKEIAKRIRLAPNYIKNKNNETVYIKFLISKTGEMDTIKLANQVSESLSKEAFRVFSSIEKKWIPAESNGETIDVWHYAKISTGSMGITR